MFETRFLVIDISRLRRLFIQLGPSAIFQFYNLSILKF